MAERTQHWDRKPKETEAAFAAFRRYLESSHDRSLTRQAEAAGCTVQVISRWAVAWKWQERAAAFDAHPGKVAQAAKDKVIASEASRWQRRRTAEAENTYRLGRRLRKRALVMLQQSLSRDNWTFATATSMAKTSVELVFMACDVGLAEDESFDPMALTPEQCQQKLVEHAARLKTLRDAVKD